MWQGFIIISIGCLISLASMADEQPKADYEVKGTLRTGIVAISGETTGTIIETKRGTFELDFGKNEVFRLKAERLNGKMVQVTGKLEIRKGVTVKERRIIHVTELEEANGE